MSAGATPRNNRAHAVDYKPEPRDVRDGEAAEVNHSVATTTKESLSVRFLL